MLHVAAKILYHIFKECRAQEVNPQIWHSVTVKEIAPQEEEQKLASVTIESDFKYLCLIFKISISECFNLHMTVLIIVSRVGTVPKVLKWPPIRSHSYLSE